MRLHPRGWGLFLCPLMNKSTFGTADYALATNNLNGRKIIKSFCGNSGLRLLLPLVFLGGDPINHQKMTILVVEPMKTPTVQEIDGSLESMQRIVGGDIEAVYLFDDPVALVCHGEGKLLGLPMNRALTDESGVPYDIVCGTFFVVGIGDEDFTSLTEQQIEKYRKKYANEMVFSVPVPSGNHKNNAIRRKTNMKDKYVLTAESVTEGHPDKLCDTIADAVVDACLEHDPTAHVACEVMATAGKIIAAGEITAAWLPDIPAVICRTVREAGYGGSDYEVEVITREQSPDIAGAVNSGAETGAGDQGIVYGYACDETPELLPLPVVLVHELTRLLTQARKLRTIPGLKPDGKAQVSVEYQFGVPKRVSAVVVSCQHEDGVELAELRHAVMRHIIQPAFQDFPLDAETEILINPSGRFVEGGFEADTGLTGRKLMVDTYGGLAPHGGRTHPKPAFPVQGAVHHHFLFGLAVAGHAQHFVFVALEMPVAARLHIVFECFHVILFYTDTRHSGAECHIYNQYSIFQHGKKGFGRKDGEKGGRRRQKPGDRVGCLNCRATDAILRR